MKRVHQTFNRKRLAGFSISVTDLEYISRLSLFHMNLSPLELKKTEHAWKLNNFKNQHTM